MNKFISDGDYIRSVADKCAAVQGFLNIPEIAAHVERLRGIADRLDAPTCSETRPCIPCFLEVGACLGPSGEPE